jgi:two-component system LytT family response regulator
VIRALIADDEAPARRKLGELLAREADFAVVAEAADGAEAVAAIRAAAPDVVFLDIQMPKLDGFGVIAEVGVEAMPLVVFVTAFDEHALRAFEVHALDYLLKPFAPSRLQRLAGRLRRQLAAAASPSAEAGPAGAAGAPGAAAVAATAAPASELGARIERLLAEMRPAPQYLRQVLVERGPDRQVLLPVEEIDLVRAEGNYLSFVSARGRFRRRGTLREIEERLDPALFLRLNRSEIVRLDAVRELQPWFHGDARVVLLDGSVLTWSRRFRSRADGLF